MNVELTAFIHELIDYLISEWQKKLIRVTRGAKPIRHLKHRVAEALDLGLKLIRTLT